MLHIYVTRSQAELILKSLPPTATNLQERIQKALMNYAARLHRAQRMVEEAEDPNYTR